MSSTQKGARAVQGGVILGAIGEHRQYLQGNPHQRCGGQPWMSTICQLDCHTVNGFCGHHQPKGPSQPRFCGCLQPLGFCGHNQLNNHVPLGLCGNLGQWVIQQTTCHTYGRAEVMSFN
jgi:hypothetical protein